MVLARVKGPVVSTIKNEALKARTLYVVEPIDRRGRPIGKTFLALDSVQSRPGDIVLITREGNGCRQILGNELAPVNALILAIVDIV